MASNIPTAQEYRVTEASIDTSVCMGREVDSVDGADRRWKPYVLKEMQCGGSKVEGSDLCKKCMAREIKYNKDPKAGAKIGLWKGRITEEPFDWAHMLGTEWAKEKKPKFTAAAPPCTTADAPASAPASAVPVLSVSEKPEPGIALYKSLLAISEAEKATLKAISEAEKTTLKARVAELEAKLAHIHVQSSA